MIELKECPFCGGHAEMWHGEYDNGYYVICDECGALTEQAFTQEEAANAWNRRVYEGPEGLRKHEGPGAGGRRVQDDEADDGK